MTINKTLITISEELENYQDSDFDECALESLTQSLESISDDMDDDSSDREFALYNLCDSQIATAERFLEDVRAEEEREQELDERRYASHQSQR
tara:strand:- start:7 stop:285 length:279 start_codon:yes stop_codon:yes gene_type:complete